jgi:hypothetical protein
MVIGKKKKAKIKIKIKIKIKTSDLKISYSHEVIGYEHSSAEVAQNFRNFHLTVEMRFFCQGMYQCPSSIIIIINLNQFLIFLL